MNSQVAAKVERVRLETRKIAVSHLLDAGLHAGQFTVRNSDALAHKGIAQIMEYLAPGREHIEDTLAVPDGRWHTCLHAVLSKRFRRKWVRYVEVPVRVFKACPHIHVDPNSREHVMFVMDRAY